MAKPRKHHDIISEQEFTIRGPGASTDPQEDSPGDSEKDAGVEFSMGMNYKPTEYEPIDDEEQQEDQDEQRDGKILAEERPENLAV